MPWRVAVNSTDREEMRVNIIVLVVWVWFGQYREELILKVTVLVVRVCGGQ